MQFGVHWIVCNGCIARSKNILLALVTSEVFIPCFVPGGVCVMDLFVSKTKDILEVAL